MAAAVGLFAGTLFLGEHYQLLTWLGAAIITAGVFITTKAQSQAGASAPVRIEPASSRS